MSSKQLFQKRKLSIYGKLDQLKTEAEIAISYIKKMFEDGKELVTELEVGDHATFLRRYSQINRELDGLVDKVIQLNYSLECSATSEGKEKKAETPVVDIAKNFIEELPEVELSLTQTHCSDGFKTLCEFKEKGYEAEKEEQFQLNVEYPPIDKTCETEKEEQFVLNVETPPVDKTDEAEKEEQVLLNVETLPVDKTDEAEKEQFQLNVQTPPCDKTDEGEKVEQFQLNTETCPIGKTDVEKLSVTSHCRVTVPCDIQEGDILDMCYIYGDNPNNFWLGNYSKKTLEGLKDMMFRRFNKGQLVSCEYPSVGMYVCVCDCQQFYRAKVLQMLKKQSVKVLVIDVDSGETKEAEVRNIYHLDDDIASVSVQCINCCLQVNVNDISLWNEEVAKLFSQVLRDSNLVVTVITKILDEMSRFIVDVDCHKEGYNISKIELSKWLTLDVFPLLHRIQQKSTAEVMTRPMLTSSDTQFDTLNNRSLTCEVGLDEAAGGQRPMSADMPHELMYGRKPDSLVRCGSLDFEVGTSSKINALKNKRLSWSPDKNESARYNQKKEYSNLQVWSPKSSEHLSLQKCKFMLFQKALNSSQGQRYEAMLAYIKNPSEFYIHIVCAENTEIDTLTSRMNEFYKKVHFSLETKKKAREYIGSFCAVYNSSDNSWYRGQVVDWKDTNDDELIHVKLIDYGDEHYVSLQEIQPLRRMFTEYPIFAHRCCLANIHPANSLPDKPVTKWPVESVNLFKCLVDVNSLYTVIVTDYRQNINSLSVLLWDNSYKICINKSMVDYGYAINFSPFEGPLDFEIHDKSDCKENEQTELSSNDSTVLEVKVERNSDSAQNTQTVSEAAVMGPMLFSSNKEVENLDRWNPMAEDFICKGSNLYHDDEDATYMVTGYKPEDEKRVCKLFATKGYCYKGETCQKEHIFVHPDGWTTDKKEVYHESFSKLVLPKEGSQIMLEITEILNANTFWAIILNSDNDNDGGNQKETLFTLNELLNQETTLRELKHLETLPGMGQVVVAKYTDGTYYRAQVVDHGENSIAVLYVDYGNKEWVPLSSIRCIEQRFLHLPFQAIECVLANVENIPNDPEGASIFHKMLQGEKIVQAEVVNSADFPKMEVLITNCQGVDVGTKIIESGHGKEVTY